MTERQLFEENIPQIAELIVEARKLTTEEYEELKEKVLGIIDKKAINFIKKVFNLVEKYR